MRFPATWTRQRKASLKALGMSTYAEYLGSPLWARIRKRVYTRAKDLCESAGCTKDATAIHHWSYALKVMRGENIKPLQAACRTCHKRHHGTRKLAPEAAARRAAKKALKAFVAAGGAVAQPMTAKPRLVKP